MFLVTMPKTAGNEPSRRRVSQTWRQSVVVASLGRVVGEPPAAATLTAVARTVES
jgi:hypothetical protein